MLFISRAQVGPLLDLDALIEALGSAFIEVSAGRASVPPRVAAFSKEGFLGAMPGFVEGTLAAKLVSVFPGNVGSGLPGHQALVALFDPSTGTPLAVMDGIIITAYRTACASAVSVKALAREDARVLTVIGAGVQGRSHAEVVPRVCHFEEVRIASRTAEHARSLAGELGAVHVESIEEAVRGADVVCLCTESPTPVIDRSWLSPGAHVTSVGFSTSGGELDRGTLQTGLLVVESRVAFEPPPAGAGELVGMDPLEAAELGEILAGARVGRTSNDQITVYKSMGHAVEDAVAARLVYEAAVARSVGTEIEL